MKLLLFLFIFVFTAYGLCDICDKNDPETTWTDANNYVIHFAIHDTVEVVYDTTFVNILTEHGLNYRQVSRIDTLYKHSDFDLGQSLKGKVKTTKIQRIIIK
jgi:hypothetical protein